MESIIKWNVYNEYIKYENPAQIDQIPDVIHTWIMNARKWAKHGEYPNRIHNGFSFDEAPFWPGCNYNWPKINGFWLQMVVSWGSEISFASQFFLTHQIFHQKYTLFQPMDISKIFSFINSTLIKFLWIFTWKMPKNLGFSIKSSNFEETYTPKSVEKLNVSMKFHENRWNCPCINNRLKF